MDEHDSSDSTDSILQLLKIYAPFPFNPLTTEFYNSHRL